MKKTLLVLCWFLPAALSSSAQTPPFSKVIWDSLQSGVNAFAVALAGDDYLLAGAYNQSQGLLVRVDSAGGLVLNRVFDGGFPSRLQTVVEVPGSGHLVAGMLHDTAFCVRTNPAADTLWTRAFQWPGASRGEIVSAALTMDSGFVLAGHFSDPSTMPGRLFAVRLDASGSVLWGRSFFMPGIEYLASRVLQVADSGFLLTGTVRYNNFGDEDALMMKLDTSGAISWTRVYNESPSVSCRGYEAAVNGTGYMFLVDAGQFKALLQVDSAGAVVSTVQTGLYSSLQGGPPVFVPSRLRRTADGGFVILCAGTEFLGSERRLAKANASGGLLWVRDPNFSSADVLEIPGQGFFCIGNGPLFGISPSPPPFSPQVGMIRTDTAGFETSCSAGTFVNPPLPFFLVDSSVAMTTDTSFSIFAMHPAIDSLVFLSDPGCVNFVGGIEEEMADDALTLYPNPSAGILHAESESPITELAVYDFVGKKVFVWQGRAGRVGIDLSALASGLYYVRCTAESVFHAAWIKE